MYRHLTTDHSLYVISSEQLEEFLTLSEQYHLKGYVEQAASTSKGDSHAIVLHIWCLFNEYEYNLFMNAEKALIYSIDAYMLHILRQQKDIKYFMECKQVSQAFKFIAAYHVACATLRWGDMVILDYEKGQQLCAVNQSRDYFALGNDMDLMQPEQIDFHLFQKEIIHLFATNYKQTNRLQQFLKHYISLAHLYRKEHL